MAELGWTVRSGSRADDGTSSADGNCVPGLSRLAVGDKLRKEMHVLYDLMVECGADDLIVSVKTSGKCYSTRNLTPHDKTGLADVYMTAEELGWTQQK